MKPANGSDATRRRYASPSVVTASDLGDFQTRSLAHGRAVTYLLTPSYGRPLADANGWDWNVVEKLMDHQQFTAADDKTVDWKYHRVGVMAPAKLTPDSWTNDTCALGSVAHCVSILSAYRQAGADEIVIYGSAPSQNAGLIDAWRNKRTP